MHWFKLVLVLFINTWLIAIIYILIFLIFKSLLSQKILPGAYDEHILLKLYEKIVYSLASVLCRLCSVFSLSSHVISWCEMLSVSNYLYLVLHIIFYIMFFFMFFIIFWFSLYLRLIIYSSILSLHLMLDNW